MFFFSAPALAAFWQATPLDSGQIPDTSGNIFLWIALGGGIPLADCRRGLRPQCTGE